MRQYILKETGERNTDFLNYHSTFTASEVLPPRDLDGRTRMSIQEMLSAFPQPKRIRVVAVFGDREPVQYANQIRDFLEESGWQTEPKIEIAAKSVPHLGVYLCISLKDTTVIEIVVGSNG